MATLLDLARAVAEDLRATLAGETAPEPLATTVDEAGKLAEAVVARLEGETPREKRRLPVCKAGCDACCRIHAVFVSPVEALRIAAHVREAWSEAEVEALRARLEALAPEVRDMTLAERGRAKIACPLLDEATGACRVHPVRPLLCRGYNSCDASVCAEALAAGDPTIVPPASLERAHGCRHVFAGLLLGAARHGVEPGPFELVCALRAALAGEDLEIRWRAGDAVFEDAGAATRISREHAAAWQAFFEAEGAKPR